ncbi:MAG: WD40/YVTN/BNR-like repeat-containing protein [Planctomycetota bacterium]|jgi:hypothetical protein
MKHCVIFLALGVSCFAINLDSYYKIGPDPDDYIKFQRASTAYDGTGEDYASDVYITKDFILTSKITLVDDDSSPPAVTLWVPCAETTGHLWAVGDGGVYKKVKGSGNWTAVVSDGLDAGVLALWSDGENRLIAFEAATGVYSTDGGTSWTAIDTMPVNTPSVANPWQMVYGMDFNGATAVVAEYDTSGNRLGQKIFKTTDSGATWAEVFDVDDDASYLVGNNGHFHCVGYHAGQDKWMAATGDITNKRVYVSSDATTWTRVVFTHGVPVDQPIHLLDIGHSNYLVCGTDTWCGVLYYDMVNDVYITNSPEYFPYRYSQEGSMYMMYYYEGIIYAFPFDANTTSTKRGTVYCSNDGGIKWSPAFQYDLTQANSSTGVRWLSGISEDNLYLSASNSASAGSAITTGMMTLPESVSTRTMILVQDEGLNIQTPVAESELDESGIVNEFVDGDISLETSGGLIATNFTRVEKATPAGTTYTQAYVSASTSTIPLNGERYGVRWYAKGETGMQYAQTYVQHATVTSSAGALFYGISDSNWHELLGGLTVSKGSGNSLAMTEYMNVGGATSTYTANNTWQVDLGGCHVSLYRTYFSKGGTDTARTSLSRQYAVGSDWTLMETVVPDLPVQLYDQYNIWDNAVDYGQNLYIQFDADAAAGTNDDSTWDGELSTYKSAGGNPAAGDNPKDDAASWGTPIESWKWHIMTLDAGGGNRIVCYLDTNLTYDTGTVVDGLKIKADVYQANDYVDTMEVAAPYAFRRWSPIQIAFTCDSTSDDLAMFVRFNDGIIKHSGDGTNTGLILAGTFTEFQDCVVTTSFSSNYSEQTLGTRYYMPQLTSWILPQNDKQFDTAYTSSEIDTEMDNVALSDNAIGGAGSGAIYRSGRFSGN